MKIRSILIVILACFTIVPVVAYAISADMQMHKIAEEQYSKVTQQMAESQSINLATYFESLQRTASTIVNDQYIQAFSKDTTDTVSLNKVVAAYDAIEATATTDTTFEIEKILMLNKDGAFITGSSPTLNSANANFQNGLDYIKSLENGVISFYNYSTFYDDSAKVNDKPAETTSPQTNAEGRSADETSEDTTKPEDNTNDSSKTWKDPFFEDSLNTKIHLVAKYNVNDIQVVVFFNEIRLKQFLSCSSFATNSRMVLVDSYGSIVDSSFVGNTKDNPSYMNLVTQASNGSATKISNPFGTGNNIVPSLAFAEKIGDTNWTMAMIAETDKAFVQSSDATGSIVGIIVLLSVLFIAGDIFLVLLITKPLKKIEETLTRIRRGDHEARIDVMSNNEYGEIARAFNDLIDDIIVSEGRYRTIIEMSDNIIFEWNFKSNEVFFSNNFNKKFSYRAPSDHFGDSFLLKVKVHPEDSERYRSDLEKLAKGEEFKQNEYRWKNIYGDYIWILMRTSTIRDRDDNIVKVVGVIVDIDRAKKSEKLLTARASFDSLTSLYNRETIERTIDNEIELINIRKNEFAILFIDVDDFKNFNDKYSHATGDQVLKFVAQTISHLIDGFGIAGRYGGDEFIACIRNAETNEPSRIAKDILNALKEGFVADSGEKLSVNVSIGISLIKDSTMRVDEIIGLADDAMYKIKKSGKSNFGFLNKPVDRKGVTPQIINSSTESDTDNAEPSQSEQSEQSEQTADTTAE